MSLVRVVLALLQRFLVEDLVAPAPPSPTSLGEVVSANEVYEKRKARQQDIEKSVQVEIHKSLINNTLEYIRSTAQVLNGVTGVLLSTYVALLVGFRRDTGFAGLGDWLYALIPMMLWVASLAGAFVMAVTSSRYDLVILDLRASMDTYAEVLRSRRRQLVWPAILTGCGLLAFLVLFNSVFVVPRQAASRPQSGPVSAPGPLVPPATPR